ncbi:glycosyltransferase family 17 protein [Flavicella marina]|uniref:hypothetical protein n=1 Tax=Flavicella marina TaxID=1475951 RepID=UPI00126589ED|nr:hypothetical protein [Flavicella marina]
MKEQKLIDCFTFFNELDLLEIRLKYLNQHVDYFVIIEADTGFNGVKKDFILQKELNRFKDFKDKIIYVPLQMPMFSKSKKEALKREKFQRNAISLGLDKIALDPKDIVMISDIDEIPNNLYTEEIKINAEHPCYKLPFLKKTKAIFDVLFKNNWNKFKLLQYCCLGNYKMPLNLTMDNLLYYLNYKEINGKWNGTMVLEYRLLKKFTPNKVRGFKNFVPYMADAGWHFSYLGGIKNAKIKLKNYSNQKHHKPEKVNDVISGDTDSKYAKININCFPIDLKNYIFNYKELMLN